MNADQSISRLLDELVTGNTGGNHLHNNLDLILTWLANPDSESVSGLRAEYVKRNISVDILRGYVFFILQQKLFSTDDLQPHEVLGLPRITSKENVKVRYRKLMRVFHPDKAPGNIDNFNSIAEKINLAYRQLTRTPYKTVHIKPETVVATKKVRPSSGAINNKVESQLARKIRHKFGSVKHFQLLFLGGVASLCLFVIVLLYLQSGDPRALQSYSSRANSLTHDTTVFETTTLKENTSAPDLIPQVNKAVDPASIEASAISDNAGNLRLEKRTVSAYQDSEQHNVENVLDGVRTVAQQQDMAETIVDKDKHDEKQVAAVENALIQIRQPEHKSGFKGNDNHQTNSAQSGLPPVKAVDKAQPLVDLLSDGLSIKTPASRTQSSVVDDNVVKKSTETEPVQVRQNAPDEGPATSTPDALVVTALQPVINDTPAEHHSEQDKIAPVKEVKVAALKKTSADQFDLANIFEKRFARKFLIKYLESIEKGDMADIRRYLSNSLMVDGVGQNKVNFLKNTNALIKQTSKRRYHVQFMGDVLRLNPGVFRVTVTLSYTYVFKNNFISKDSVIKKYDIKRYANGSEIINISSA